MYTLCMEASVVLGNRIWIVLLSLVNTSLKYFQMLIWNITWHTSIFEKRFESHYYCWKGGQISDYLINHLNKFKVTIKLE